MTRNVATFNITSVVQIFIRFKRAVAAEQPGDGGELAGAASTTLEYYTLEHNQPPWFETLNHFLIVLLTYVFFLS